MILHQVLCGSLRGNGEGGSNHNGTNGQQECQYWMRLAGRARRRTFRGTGSQSCFQFFYGSIPLLRKQCRAACDDFAERTFRTFTSWISAGEHLVEQGAQCIDIGAGVRLAEAVLLRSSIFSRTQENRILWFPGIKFTGCIEIDENYVVGGSQKDIGRFDITMDVGRIAAMKGRENITQLAYDIDGSILWKVKRII